MPADTRLEREMGGVSSSQTFLATFLTHSPADSSRHNTNSLCYKCWHSWYYGAKKKEECAWPFFKYLLIFIFLFCSINYSNQSINDASWISVDFQMLAVGGQCIHWCSGDMWLVCQPKIFINSIPAQSVRGGHSSFSMAMFSDCIRVSCIDTVRWLSLSYCHHYSGANTCIN